MENADLLKFPKELASGLYFKPVRCSIIRVASSNPAEVMDV
jgi:hypothetical protein